MTSFMSVYYACMCPGGSLPAPASYESVVSCLLYLLLRLSPVFRDLEAFLVASFASPQVCH